MCVPANSVKRGPAGNWKLGNWAAPADPPVAPALATFADQKCLRYI